MTITPGMTVGGFTVISTDDTTTVIKASEGGCGLAVTTARWHEFVTAVGARTPKGRAITKLAPINLTQSEVEVLP